jgi:hypothetical protein
VTGTMRAERAHRTVGIRVAPDDALAEAMRLSGARSKKDLALREYAARHRRIGALDHYATAAQTWDYEGWQDMHAAGRAPAA